LRSVVHAFEFDFVHQCPDELQSPTAATLAVVVRSVLIRNICRNYPAARNSHRQLVAFDAKALINFSIGTEAVFGGVNARLDQSEFDLVNGLWAELDAPRNRF